MNRIAVNSIWYMGERIVNSLAALFIFVALTRLLHQDRLGEIIFYVSIFQIFSGISHLGLNGLVAKEFVERPKDVVLIKNEVVKLRFLANTLVLLAVFFALSLFVESVNEEVVWLWGIGALLLSLNCAEIVSVRNDTELKSKINTKLKFISNVVSIGALWVLFVLEADWYFYVIALLGTDFIRNLLLIVLDCKELSVFRSIRLDITIPFLKKSWPLILSSLSALVYIKIDQVMIGGILGKAEVAQYSVASRISEFSLVFAAAVATSFFPSLIRIKNEESAEYYSCWLKKVFSFLIVSALVVIAGIFVFGGVLVDVIFGDAYASSYHVLMIYSLSLIFVFPRQLVSKWLVGEELYMYSLVSHGLGAISNVVLNFVFIYWFGMLGAAVATVISYSIASYFSFVLFSPTKYVFGVMSEAYVYSVKPKAFLEAIGHLKAKV